LRKREIDGKYEEIVNFSELRDVMNVKLKDFSDGMIMRLSFSIAFHVNADIILIDEILAVGDAAFQIKCLEKIKKLKEEGKTIVLVSHATAHIRKFCDKAILLENGKIISFGEASKVCEKYEEIIERDRLRRWNEEVEKESSNKFTTSEEFILMSGERCKIEVRTPQLGPIELLFEGKSCVRAFSKLFENEKAVFQTDSLPLSEGEYMVWIKQKGEFLSKRPFKILVKGLRESKENRVYISPNSAFPFQTLTIVFGENPEIEMEMFEKGKTLFVFQNLQDAMHGKRACLIKENKVIATGEKEFVLELFKKEIWRELALKHFKHILLKTKLGKALVVS
jgi:ABC-type multidrug transport system ATPase subunit